MMFFFCRLVIRCLSICPGSGWMVEQKNFGNDGVTSWSINRRFCWKRTRTKTRKTWPPQTPCLCAKRRPPDQLPYALSLPWVSRSKEFVRKTVLDREINIINTQFACWRLFGPPLKILKMFYFKSAYATEVMWVMVYRI